MSDTPQAGNPHGSEHTGAETPRVRATFDGEPLEAEAGASVASALIATGTRSWRTTREGRSRGLFCGIGVCFDCLVEIDGESGQRACMIPLGEGMDVRSASGPRTTHDAHPDTGTGTGRDTDGVDAT